MVIRFNKLCHQNKTKQYIVILGKILSIVILYFVYISLLLKLQYQFLNYIPN